MKLNYVKAKQLGYNDDQILRYAKSRGIEIKLPDEQAKPQKKGRGLLDLLSVGTSIGGGLLGSLAGPVGTVGGAAGGGALGEFLEQKISGEDTNIGDIGTEALWGGGGAVAGMGLGKLLQLLRGTGGEIAKSSIRTGVKAGSGFSQSVDDIAGVSSKYGLTGSSAEKASKAARARTVVGGQLEELLGGAKSLKTTDIKGFLKTKMANSVLGSEDKAYSKAMDFYLKQVKSGKPSELLKLRDTLYPLTQTKSAIPSARQAAVREMYDGLNELLQKVPGAKELVRTQPLLHGAEAAYSAGAKRGVNIPFMGTSQTAARPVQALKDLLGRGATKVGNIDQGRMGTLLTQIGGQAGARSLRPSGGDQLPQEDTTSLPLEGQVAEPQEEGLMGLLGGEDTTKALKELALLDLLQNGGKNISKIETLISLLEPEETSEGEAKQKALTNSIDLLMDSYQKAGGGQGAGGVLPSLLGRTPGVRSLGLAQEAQVFEDNRKGLIAPLARAISGEVGVLTDKDISRAEGFLPRLTDPPEVARQKIQKLYTLIQQAGTAGATSSGILNTGDFLQ